MIAQVWKFYNAVTLIVRESAGSLCMMDKPAVHMPQMGLSWACNRLDTGREFDNKAL